MRRKCPQCGTLTSEILPECRGCGTPFVNTKAAPSRGLFGKITGIFADRKLKKSQVEELRLLLSSAVSDGEITDEELKRVNEFFAQSELAEEDFAKVRNIVFNQVLSNFTRDRRINNAEYDALYHIGRRLGMTEMDLQAVESHISYYKLLHSLETAPFDRLPATRSSNLLLQRGEIDYFCTAANMLEERVIKREIVGRSQGVSVRLMKGVSYRVGQSRGRVQTEKGMVPISHGTLTITNKRLVFSGDRKSVNAPYPKLQDMEIFRDGLRFSLTTRQTPVTIQFFTKETAELSAMYLSRMLNQ